MRRARGVCEGGAVRALGLGLGLGGVAGGERGGGAGGEARGSGGRGGCIAKLSLGESIHHRARPRRRPSDKARQG